MHSELHLVIGYILRGMVLDNRDWHAIICTLYMSIICIFCFCLSYVHVHVSVY